MMLLSLAIQDIKKTILQYRIWMHLGCIEVKQRYRRSVLGPWWISLSLLIFIVMMGIVFSRLFHQTLSEYIPFFTAGFLFWTFISNSIVEAADIFKLNAGFIKQINLPFNIYVFKFLVRQTIFLFHNFFVYILVCIFFKVNPGIKFFLILPGFVLLTINIYWISLFVSIICARFRDMGPIVSSCMQIAFFITPISWMPKLLDQYSKIIKFNFFASLLDIVRAPLLGLSASAMSWYISTAMAIGGCLISFVIFSLTRSRIAFWVD